MFLLNTSLDQINSIKSTSYLHIFNLTYIHSGQFPWTCLYTCCKYVNIQNGRCTYIVHLSRSHLPSTSELGFGHAQLGLGHAELGFGHVKLGFTHAEMGFRHAELRLVTCWIGIGTCWIGIRTCSIGIRTCQIGIRACGIGI